MSGEDWLLGKVGMPKAAKKIPAPSAEPLDFDAVESLMDSKKDGEKLRTTLDAGVSAIEALKKTGLTGEALVVLVHAKCRTPQRGGKPPSQEAVQLVLEALFRLGEYVR